MGRKGIFFAAHDIDGEDDHDRKQHGTGEIAQAWKVIGELEIGRDGSRGENQKGNPVPTSVVWQMNSSF